MIKLIIGVVIAAIAVIGGFLLLEPVVSGTAGGVTEIGDTYSYTIEGEVAKPGTYVLSDAISMADLIDAAGGATYNADERSYFETAVLKAGSTYYIAGKYDETDICNDRELTKVNINSDNAETLSSINGISASIASSIVSYRAENGTFQTIEELLEVYGIGNATYHKVRNYVILHEWSSYISSYRFGLDYL